MANGKETLGKVSLNWNVSKYSNVVFELSDIPSDKMVATAKAMIAKAKAEWPEYNGNGDGAAKQPYKGGNGGAGKSKSKTSKSSDIQLTGEVVEDINLRDGDDGPWGYMKIETDHAKYKRVDVCLNHFNNAELVAKRYSQGDTVLVEGKIEEGEYKGRPQYKLKYAKINTPEITDDEPQEKPESAGANNEEDIPF